MQFSHGWNGLFLLLRLYGSISAFVIVVFSISSDMYLQYSCLVDWEISNFTFAVKVVAGIGGGLKAAFLTILNRSSARRVPLSALGLSSTLIFRILGKVFDNSLLWSLGPRRYLDRSNCKTGSQLAPLEPTAHRRQMEDITKTTASRQGLGLTPGE